MPIFLLFLLLAVVKPSFGGEARVLNLEDSVNLGLRNNKEIIYLGEDLKQQVQALNEQYRKFFPQLNVGYGDMKSSYLNSADTNYKAYNVNVSQMIYDGDKLKNQIITSQVSYMLAILDSQKKKVDYIYSVISAYLSILKQQERIRLKTELYENQKKEWDVTKKSHELGEATLLDVLEWEIELNQSQIDLKELQNNVQFEKMNFNKILGVSLGTEFIPAQRFRIDAKLDYQDFDENSVMQSSLVNSTDLKQLELAIKKSKSSSLQNTLFLPDVSLTASYSTRADKPFRGDDIWNVGLNVVFPFFFDSLNIQAGLGGDIKGSQRNLNDNASSTVYQNPAFFRQLEAEKYSLDKLEYQYKETIEGIKLNVKKSLSDLAFQAEKIRILDDKIRLSEGKNVIIKQQLKLGEIQLSEYIKFQNSLNSMRVDRIETIYSYLSQIINILKMEGMLIGSDMKSFYDSFLTESSIDEITNRQD